MMKRLIIIVSICSIVFSCNQSQLDVHWQVNSEEINYAITLNYSLTKEELQRIVGDEYKIAVDENGMGKLMLFISSGEKYYLDEAKHDDFQIAHILVRTENSLNSAFAISGKNQPLTKVYDKFDILTGTGKVEKVKDSLIIQTILEFPNGIIELVASMPNISGEKWEANNIKLTGKTPNKFFVGRESGISVPTKLIKIENHGDNWISKLKLPPTPNSIVFSTNNEYDFIFKEDQN